VQFEDLRFASSFESGKLEPGLIKSKKATRTAHSEDSIKLVECEAQSPSKHRSKQSRHKTQELSLRQNFTIN
jgi:hypothetical protein